MLALEGDVIELSCIRSFGQVAHDTYTYCIIFVSLCTVSHFAPKSFLISQG